MSKSRWGGFRKGRQRYATWWEELRTPAAVLQSVPAPTSPTEFNYTTAQGIWNLNSTVNFRGTLATSGGGGAPSYTTGFSNSLDTISGQVDGWRQRTVDISSYAGATVRLVFHYTNGASGFTGDIQLDNINIDGNSYSFENTGHSFETSGSGEASYASVSWISLTGGTTNARWNVYTGGTPSSGTGRTDAASGSYFVYAETTSPANVLGYNFWLRSPQITLSSSPTLTYFETRLGADIGTLNVHLDVIA